MLALTGIRFVFHVCKMFISFYHLGFLIMQHWLNIKGLGKRATDLHDFSDFSQAKNGLA